MTLFYRIPSQKEVLAKKGVSYEAPLIVLSEQDFISKVPFEKITRRNDHAQSEWMEFLSTDLYRYDFKIKDRHYTLDIKCKLIYDEIINSKKYLQYADGWDDENAIGCNEAVYLRAIDFLVEYTRIVLNSHDVVLKVPEINLGRDGSIDIEWRLKDRSLLLNFLNREDYEMHFYGRTKNVNVSLEGILNDKKINIDLTNWMQYLV